MPSLRPTDSPGASTPGSAACAALVLAAGASRRLGQPKQLLAFGGRSLLRRAAEAAVGSGAQPVLVVLGHEAERLRGELTGLRVATVVNPDYEDGLASSIRVGLATLAELAPAAAGVLLLPCDQPLVSAELLSTLFAAAFRPDAPAPATSPVAPAPAASPAVTFPALPPLPPLVACRYAGVLGPPALFPRRCFPELLALTGDRGARVVLERHRDHVVAIEFPDGALDLDTVEDYALLLARASSSTPR